MTSSARWARFYAVIRKIPRGRIATYGQVARLAALPRHARDVGHALRSLPDGSGVPWQRVVNAKGEISPRCHPYAQDLQRDLLERENVVFDGRGRVCLPRFQWKAGRPT